MTTNHLNVVSVGDLHMDGMSADLGPDANRLQVAELAKVEAWAVRNGVDEVWYLGDIGNKAIMSYDAHELLLTQWSLYPHLTRRIILGNHDWDEDGRHSLRLMKKVIDCGLLPHVIIYETPTREIIGGVPVNFLPYPYPDVDTKFKTAGAVNVGHCEVKGSTRDNGSRSCSKVELDDRGFWVMGHLHTPHDVGDWCHYVGTLYQRNFGESLPKSFTHLQARVKDGRLQKKVRRIPHTPAFTLTNLDVQSLADLKKVDNNPLHLFKLFVSAVVKVPEQFLTDHPNVVRHQPYKNKRERDALIEERIALTQDHEDDDPFENLEEYLKVKQGLEGKQLKRALRINDEIRAAVGL
jgi:hypothetical protein